MISITDDNDNNSDDFSDNNNYRCLGLPNFILFYFFSNFCYIILHLNAFNEFIFSGMFLIFVLADHMYSNRNIQW